MTSPAFRLLQVRSVHIHSQKLKGGFISNVLKITVKLEAHDDVHLVCKLENHSPSFLSKMAVELGLYEKEYYFYSTIAEHARDIVDIPQFYGFVNNAQGQRIGILLQNCFAYGYHGDVKASDLDVNQCLRIIESLAKFHARFWCIDIPKHFPECKKNVVANPKWAGFVASKFGEWCEKWSGVLREDQIQLAGHIVQNFAKIQEDLSSGALTVCHGDVKLPNMFFSSTAPAPVFIDWQYITNGKGVQDLVFLMIESFEVEQLDVYFELFVQYYWVCLKQSNIHYEYQTYREDMRNAAYYFPFFVCIWFGTVPEDDLIDKNFPFFFIKKCFAFYERLGNSVIVA